MFRHSRSFLVTIAVLVFSTSFAFCLPLEKCADYATFGYPGGNGQLLCRTGYLLSHSAEYKTPIWVIEHLTRAKAKAKLPRKDKFAPDPDLAPGRRAEKSDYKGSGYARGHMAPSADMRWNQIAMDESFYLSNMVPQNGPMNSGIWQVLENHARNWAIARNGVIYSPARCMKAKKRRSARTRSQSRATSIK